MLTHSEKSMRTSELAGDLRVQTISAGADGIDAAVLLTFGEGTAKAAQVLYLGPRMLTGVSVLDEKRSGQLRSTSSTHLRGSRGLFWSIKCGPEPSCGRPSHLEHCLVPS